MAILGAGCIEGWLLLTLPLYTYFTLDKKCEKEKTKSENVKQK